MTPALAEARRLLALAQADQAAFLWLLQGPGLRPSAAFFFAQQAIEKALKAVMMAHDLVPTRTHNLLSLAAELDAASIPSPYSPDELAVFNPYAVTLRYDDAEISLIEPAKAQEMVAAVLGWAEGLLV